MSEGFTKKTKRKCLLWCNRRCCVCGKSCGTSIEIAHIIPKAKGGSNDIDNAIPVCLDHHAMIGHYNPDHPIGNKYKPEELKALREKIYEEQTAHLVPKMQFEITQVTLPPRPKRRVLPDVGFNVFHLQDSLPVKVLVSTETFLGDRSFGVPETGPYSGKEFWHRKPGTWYQGHFDVPAEAVNSEQRLKIRVRITILDHYERPHVLPPVDWVYKRNTESWYPEP